MGNVRLFQLFFCFLFQIFFFLGFFPVLGLSETLFFFQKKIKGSICFFVGLIFLLTNVCFIGFSFQMFGLYEFFKNVFPKLLPFLYEIPYVKDVLPVIEDIINTIKYQLGFTDSPTLTSYKNTYRKEGRKDEESKAIV